MTLFEYLAIAYSLILSFAVIRLVGGLRHVLNRGRRYLVHACAVCLILFGSLALFWAHWSTRDLEWTFPVFLVNLSGPAMFYFLASTIVPDEPAKVESWQDYYYSVRVPFYSGLCAYGIIMVLNTSVLLGTPLFHRVRVVQAGVLALGIVGLATARPVVHRALLLGALFLAAVIVVILLRPGSIAA